MNWNKGKIQHVMEVLGILAYILCFTPATVSAENSNSEKFETAKNLIHEYSGKGDNYTRAISIAEEIFNKDSNSPYSYLIIAELKARKYKDYKEGNPLEIWMLTNRVNEINNSISATYVIQAKLANLQGNLELARQNSETAIQLDPGNREAMFESAEIEQQSGNFVEAEKWFKKTIASHTDPDRKSNIYYWLSKMYMDMQPPNIDGAQEAMQKMVDLSPKAPWKLVNYAIFLNANTNDFDGAIKYSRASLDIMDFEMGRLILGVASYARWAEGYSEGRPAGGSLAASKKVIKEIEKETGVTPIDAMTYASNYMRESKIIEAFKSIGVI